MDSKKDLPIGIKEEVNENIGVPDNLNKWSWGAFFWTFIWGVAHNYYLPLIVFIPVIGQVLGLPISIYLGAKGNQIAWENRKWKSVEEFKEVQKKWANWAIIWFIILFVGAILLIGLMFVFLSDSPMSSGNNISTAQAKARDAQRKSNMYQIETSIYDYEKDINEFPKSLQDLVPKYLPAIPTINGTEYVKFTRIEDNIMLSTELENGGDMSLTSDAKPGNGNTYDKLISPIIKDVSQENPAI